MVADQPLARESFCGIDRFQPRSKTDTRIFVYACPWSRSINNPLTIRRLSPVIRPGECTASMSFGWMIIFQSHETDTRFVFRLLQWKWDFILAKRRCRIMFHRYIRNLLRHNVKIEVSACISSILLFFIAF